MRHRGRQKFKIYKASGRPENFSRKKLLLSLEHSGLPKRKCQSIVDKVCQEITEGSKTSDIYKKTLQLVKETSPLASAHYSLKRALFDLGPEGHHFEEFVARFFQEEGYKTTTCEVHQGKLVKHEVDVVAHLPGRRYFGECKFHNRAGIKNDIKISLYVKARWDDLKAGPLGEDIERFYIFSNTAFSEDAIIYGRGSGMTLMGVNSPLENSFLDQIKRFRLYPLTSVRSIPKFIRNELLKRKIILAKDLQNSQSLLRQLGLGEAELGRIIAEVNLLEGKT
jgi:hypothetical protein